MLLMGTGSVLLGRRAGGARASCRRRGVANQTFI